MHSPTMRRGRCATWRSALGVVGIALFAFPPIAAAALKGGPPAEPPLRNPITMDIHGKRVAPNVCEYTSTIELPPGAAAVREDTTLFDDATCTVRVQRGTPFGEEAPADQPGSASKRGEAAAASDARSLAGSRRTLATHSKGYHKSYFEDPVQLDVNSVNNSVDWYWNGSSVWNGYCAYHYGWLSGSGWQLKDNNFFCRYEDSQTKLRSSSFVHFRNGIFCLTIDTHTYYERNNAYGRRDGYLIGTVNWRKEGGCTGLLSFHHFVKRTLN